MHAMPRLRSSTRADQLVVNGVPLADVTRLRRRQSLARVMHDGIADAGTLKLARKDRS
jgi:hypothetical protein